MKQGDIVWAYNTVPTQASPYFKPARVVLVEKLSWYDRTLWSCEIIEEPHRGSRWHWDESWLAPEPVRPGASAVE